MRRGNLFSDGARALRLCATRFVYRVWASKGVISTLLLPLSWITACVMWQRRRQPRQHVHSRLPVVVVGNILVGGTGKTPVVLAVIQALQARGFTPGLISRGYGASLSTTPRHGVGMLDPAHFGDEPSLIAAHTGVPVVVHRDRAHALQVLEQFYPAVDVVVSDDGLQHLALRRDIEIAVQDRRGCGNGRLLPAGPLRESARRLDHVDFLITQIDADTQPALDALSASAPHVIQSTMQLYPAVMQHLASDSRMAFEDWLAHYADIAVSAVAGIGVPERFFHMLRCAGVYVERTASLADHDDYRHPPFDQLPAAPILITPKDAVKCRHMQDKRLWVVHPRADFDHATWLDVLAGRLQHLQWQHDHQHT